MLMMVYLFHLYNSGSRRDVIEPMVYLFHLHNSGYPRRYQTSSMVYFFHLRYTDQ
jgi:hypothetical protein